MGRAAIGLSYLVVVTVFVGVSVYTIREGYASLLGNLSWFIAAAFGFCLLAADLVFRNNRAANLSLLRPLLFLLICMILSAPSHFNYFYNYALGHIVAADKMADAVAVFEKNHAAAASALAVADKSRPTLDRVTSLMTELHQQISDDSREGWGTRAQGLYEDIRKQVSFADIKAPRIGSNKDEALRFFNNQLRPIIDGARSALRKNDQAVAALSALDNSKAEVERLRSARRDSGPGIHANTSTIAAINLIGEVQRQMETVVDQTLTNVEKRGWRLPRAPVPGGEADIEGVANSFRSGWIEMKYPHITAVAAVTTSLIDLIPLLFVLLLISPGGAVPEKEPRTAPPKPGTARPDHIN